MMRPTIRSINRVGTRHGKTQATIRWPRSPCPAAIGKKLSKRLKIPSPQLAQSARTPSESNHTPPSRTKEEALAWIEDSLKTDAFNFGCLFEKYLITRDETVLIQLRNLMKRGAPDYEALVLDYTSAGRFEEALAVAELAIAQPVGEQTLLHYYKSWCLIRLGKTAEAQIAIATAEKEPADYCFPNALEAIEALQCVVDFAGKAPKALYYLGNLWYDKRRYPTAIAAWERSSREDETFPTVWRNLSLAYFNKMNRPDEALALLEKHSAWITRMPVY